MRKTIMSLAMMAFTGLPCALVAQDVQQEKEEKIELKEKQEKKEKIEKKEKVERKESQEIVIRNRGDKDINLKVEIKGDKITVNGKPLEEFKDDEVSINKRKMIIRDGDMTFNFDGESFGKDFMGQWKGNDKEVIRPFLGVTTEKVEEGAKIIEVVKESAAEKAGLKKGDIITKVGDETISDADDLSEVISSKKPKEPVTVSYLRNGKQSSIKTNLGERKVKSPLAFAYTHPRGRVKSFSMPRVDMLDGDRVQGLGSLAPLEGADFSPYIQYDNVFSRQKRLGLKIQDTEEGGNVKVIDVEEGSAAEKAGLKKDDIITEIGGEKIENTDDAREQLMPSEAKTAYTIKAKRNGSEMTFEVKFPKKLKTANL